MGTGAEEDQQKPPIRLLIDGSGRISVWSENGAGHLLLRRCLWSAGAGDREQLQRVVGGLNGASGRAGAGPYQLLQEEQQAPAGA